MLAIARVGKTYDGCVRALDRAHEHAVTESAETRTGEGAALWW